MRTPDEPTHSHRAFEEVRCRPAREWRDEPFGVTERLSSICRGWRTLPCGQPQANERSGQAAARLHALMLVIAGARLMTLSMPIQSPLVCGSSWRSATHGEEAPPSQLSRTVERSVSTVSTGP